MTPRYSACGDGVKEDFLQFSLNPRDWRSRTVPVASSVDVGDFANIMKSSRNEKMEIRWLCSLRLFGLIILENPHGAGDSPNGRNWKTYVFLFSLKARYLWKSQFIGTWKLASSISTEVAQRFPEMALEMTGTVSILKVGIFKRRFSSDMSITGRNLPFFLDLVKRRENQKGNLWFLFLSLHLFLTIWEEKP